MQTNSQAWTWMLRTIWVLQPLAMVPIVGEATQNLSGSGQLVVAVAVWAGWAAVLLATLVPSTVSLTGGRLAAPLSLVIIAFCAIGASVAGWKVMMSIVGAALGMIAWFSGDIGVTFAQGSAYGDEQRFPLKPPVPSIVPMVALWLALAGVSVSGVTVLANGLWIVGALLIALAAAAAVFLSPRFHLLARRWLVVVPVGVVIHDPMLLMENALFRNNELEALHLAPSTTEAADLTGGTAGVSVEIVLRDVDTVVKVGNADQPTGVALHVRSVLVSPSRPGKALAAAAARRLPVG